VRLSEAVPLAGSDRAMVQHSHQVAAGDAASGGGGGGGAAIDVVLGVNMPSAVDSEMRVIEISVGGKVFAAASSTWGRFSGSLLAGLVDEKWQGQVLRDADGRIFIDRSPALFHHVLSFLRSPTEPIEGIAEEDEPAFKRELVYYGLDSLVYSADELRSPVFWHTVDLHSEEPFDVQCEYSILVCEALTCRACERTQEGVTHLEHTAWYTDNYHPREVKSGWDRRNASTEHFETRLATCCKTCIASEDPRLKRYPATAISTNELIFGVRSGFNGQYKPPGAQVFQEPQHDRPKTLLQRTLHRRDKRWLRNANEWVSLIAKQITKLLL
jgi:hypothetical protein